MKKSSSILVIIVIFLISCNSGDKNAPDAQGPNVTKKMGKQLNISILWDLSDRIKPEKGNLQPSNADRDIAIIKYFAEYFKTDMDKKGAFMSKGKLKVFFSPDPSDQNINTLAAKLDIDLEKKDVKIKKQIYDSISSDFEQISRQITSLTIKTSKWEGSDIYGFFKNSIDLCISKDTSYRNILVLLTDGYLLHPNSKLTIKNRSEFITSSQLTSLGLRTNKFKEVFDAKDCGLIAPRTDLNNLEILVLEVNPEINYKEIDEAVIKLYLKKWFSDMKVKHSEVYSTDLPINTAKRISEFLNIEQ